MCKIKAVVIPMFARYNAQQGRYEIEIDAPLALRQMMSIKVQG